MQEFNLNDTEYYHDDNSKHPAYLFIMSARDCAGFGLLYLANGRWQGQQIILIHLIPIQKSLSPFQKWTTRLSTQILLYMMCLEEK